MIDVGNDKKEANASGWEAQPPHVLERGPWGWGFDFLSSAIVVDRKVSNLETSRSEILR